MMKNALRVAMLALWLAGPAVAADVAQPEGYRSAPYNAPVPDAVPGAVTIDMAEAQRLRAAGVPFLDVYPRTKRPEGLPAGTLWREPAHETIPGAVWLPGTGFDALAPAEEALLEAGLASASGGDPARQMVIFCRTDCWLSWNASKRAALLGYTGIRWFPDGADGWQAAGGSLAPAQPFEP